MKKIALLPGHATAKEGSAVCAGKYKGWGEHKLALSYLPALAAELERLGYEVVITSRESAGGTSPSYSAIAANATGADIALEWHFNAATPTASGCEVMYWGKSATGRAFASQLSASLADILQVRNRGALAVPTPDNRGTEAFRRSRMPFFMIEPCFAGSNPDEAKKLCTAIAEGKWPITAAYAIHTAITTTYP